MATALENGRWIRQNRRLQGAAWHQNAVRIAVLTARGSQPGAVSVGSQLRSRKAFDALQLKDDVTAALSPLQSLGISTQLVTVEQVEGGVNVSIAYRLTVQAFVTSVFVRVT